MPPYRESYPTGSPVQIAGLAELQEFRQTWHAHNPLKEAQLAFAGRHTTVREVGYYHGGDCLYQLEGIPGTWHESCLRPFDPDSTD